MQKIKEFKIFNKNRINLNRFKLFMQDNKNYNMVIKLTKIYNPDKI